MTESTTPENSVPLVIYSKDGSRTIVGTAVILEEGDLTKFVAFFNTSEVGQYLQSKIQEETLTGLSIDYTHIYNKEKN